MAGPGDNPGPSQPQWHSCRLSVAICLLLAAAVWAVFGQTRHFGFVNYDDDQQVYQHPVVKNGLGWRGVSWAFTHSDDGHWVPLSKISHMLDCQLYGLEPGGHHLTNVLLHAATAMLLFLVLRRMTGVIWPGAFVAAVFALHPLRVESVAWVTERKDVLSGLFFMLTLWAYARYAQSGTGDTCQVTGKSPVRPRITFHLSPAYWLALFFFAGGLMSKAMVATLPLVLLLVDYWPLRRCSWRGTVAAGDEEKQRPDFRRLILEKVLFLGLLVAAGVGLLFSRDKNGVVVAAALETGQGLVPHKDFAPDLMTRTGEALLTPLIYIKQMFFPADLVVFYPPASRVPPGAIVMAVMVLVAVSAVAWARRRKQPYLMVGWFWYLVMLVPVLVLIQQGAEVRCDRYTYLPQIGLYIMAAWGAPALCTGWRCRRVVLGSVAVAIVGGLLAGAYVQTSYWKDSISLWTHALACTSDNFLAQNDLGTALGDQGKWDEAIGHYERALQLMPDNAEVHFNFAVALAGKKQWDEAIEHYTQALRLQPDYPEAHNNLGVALARQAKWDEAIRHFEHALRLKPDFAEACNNLGLMLAARGKWDEARQQFQRALALATTQGNTALAGSISNRFKAYPPISTPSPNP